MENNDLEEGKKPLTIQQRMKIGRRMRRLAPKLVRARKRAAKKMANTEKLMKRAQKAAIKLARKKVAGKKGLAYAKLSPGEKISVDKMVSKRYTSDRIKKIAKKLMPKVRKAEVQRLQLARGGGEQTEQVEKQPLTIQQLLWESGGAGEWGTTKLRNKYASETPGQVAEKEDKDIKDRPGKQPAKYYAKDAEGDEMSKSTKTARARHFEKGAKKDDNDPSAYKPAPGDKSAKTKPSKYTKKYKQMFGEGEKEKAAKERIKREKESNKRKYDAILDRARNQDVRTRNMKESIIDIPRRTYAPGVFDDVESKDPKIKPSVKKLIDAQLKEFEKEYPIIKTALIGSILTKRYRNDADLDINVLFDVPKEKAEEERERLSQKYLSSKNPDNIQGKEIPGTKHPINYYFVTDEKTYDGQNSKADAVFDIENNKFIKRPEDYTFDPKLYVKDFEKKVQEIDVVKGELTRDIIDYDELKELKPDDILNLQDKINSKLKEIQDGIEDIIKIGDGVDAERRAAFDKDMSPEEIKKFSIKNRLPKNVVYKMLEKYHYLTFYKKCKKILDDGKVTDKEIDSLTEGAADKSLAKKAEKSGISVGILRKVYNRGVAAWRTGHRPGTTPEQWGHARVNSFITGGKTRTTADADLWKKHKG